MSVHRKYYISFCVSTSQKSTYHIHCIYLYCALDRVCFVVHMSMCWLSIFPANFFMSSCFFSLWTSRSLAVNKEHYQECWWGRKVEAKIFFYFESVSSFGKGQRGKRGGQWWVGKEGGGGAFWKIWFLASPCQAVDAWRDCQETITSFHHMFFCPSWGTCRHDLIKSLPSWPCTRYNLEWVPRTMGV